MADTSTELFPGVGGSKMDESLVTTTEGQVHRTRVATGGDDGSLQTFTSESGLVKADVKDASVLAQLVSIAAQLTSLLAELAQKTEPADAQTVVGTVAVSNFPATQAVTGPLTDAQLRATAVPVTGPLTDAQLRVAAVPVSQVSQPLPADAATETTLALIETTLALIKAKTDNIDVALSTRTKPADQQHVLVDNIPATQAVSVASLPLPADAATENTLAVVAIELAQKLEPGDTVNVGNFPATQPVSATALPLPTGAATEATLAALTKPTDQQEAVEPYLKQRFDIQATVAYVGYAPRGTADNAPFWKIKRTDFDVLGNPTQTVWTNTTAVWNDRTTESYT